MKQKQRSELSMKKQTITALDNIFENEQINMNHIAMIGKQTTGKNELLQQLIGSLLQSGKKVICLQPSEGEYTLLEKWNPYKVRNKEELNEITLSAESFIFLETVQVDFDNLFELLKANESQWVLIQNNIEELIPYYNHNEHVTRKIDFLYYISEFGKIFDIYSFMIGKDFEELEELLPVKRSCRHR